MNDKIVIKVTRGSNGGTLNNPTGGSGGAGVSRSNVSKKYAEWVFWESQIVNAQIGQAKVHSNKTGKLITLDELLEQVREDAWQDGHSAGELNSQG